MYLRTIPEGDEYNDNEIKEVEEYNEIEYKDFLNFILPFITDTKSNLSIDPNRIFYREKKSEDDAEFTFFLKDKENKYTYPNLDLIPELNIKFHTALFLFDMFALMQTKSRFVLNYKKVKVNSKTQKAIKQARKQVQVEKNAVKEAKFYIEEKKSKIAYMKLQIHIIPSAKIKYSEEIKRIDEKIDDKKKAQAEAEKNTNKALRILSAANTAKTLEIFYIKATRFLKEQYQKTIEVKVSDTEAKVSDVNTSKRRILLILTHIMNIYFKSESLETKFSQITHDIKVINAYEVDTIDQYLRTNLHPPKKKKYS